MNPCCTGSRPSSPASPSTVSTRRPSAITPRTVQLFTSTPSRSTTHAPQFEVSQPQCVPGETEVVTQQVDQQDAWFDVGRASLAVDRHGDVHEVWSSSPRAGNRGVQGALGQLAGEVTLVLGRAALVGARRAVLGGERRRRGDRLVGGRSAAERVLGGRGAELLGADRGEPDPDLADVVAVEPDAGPGGGDGPVAGPPLHLAIRRTSAGTDRHADLGDHLRRTDRRLVGPVVELTGRHRPGSGSPLDDDRRPQRRRTRPRGPRWGRLGRSTRRPCRGCARSGRR